MMQCATIDADDNYKHGMTRYQSKNIDGQDEDGAEYIRLVASNEKHYHLRPEGAKGRRDRAVEIVRATGNTRVDRAAVKL